MRAVRVVVSVFGGGLLLWGLWLLLSTQRIDQLVNLALWLGGAVIVHDLVLVPLLTFLRRRRGSRPS